VGSIASAPAITDRFVGIDVNPEYVTLARQSHPRLKQIGDWICAPVEQCVFEPASFDLIHAALLLEYVEPSVVLPLVAEWLAPQGALSIVLQLPGGDAQISETGSSSLQLLSGRMRLVPPERLCALAAAEGLIVRSTTQIPLARGKSFWFGTFSRRA